MAINDMSARAVKERVCQDAGRLFRVAGWLQSGVVLLLMALASAAVCAGPTTNATPIFSDTGFQKGFLLSHPDSSKGRSVEKVLDFGDTNNVPVWRLCQWASKYNLASASCLRGEEGFVYENEAKRVVTCYVNSPNRGLTLEIRGSVEYGAQARKAGENWPHLLVEQDAAQVIALDAMQSLRFRIQARLLHCKCTMAGEDYDAGLHAAQFQIFFIIKNIRPGSADYGNYYWFGVPFFDNRHDVPPPFMAADAGKKDATGKYIYTLGGETLGEAPLKLGQWMALDVDLLPYIERGLRKAAGSGYLKNSNPHDYAVANMNMGWEIPGTFDAAMQVRDLEVLGVVKARGRSR